MPRFRPVLLFFLSLTLTACTTTSAASVSDHGVAHAAGGEPSTPPPTSFAPTRPPIAEALFTAAPTLALCAETRGLVAQISIPSDTLNYPIDARLYLPP